MKNLKFVEFITKFENFYNLLSEENKQLISDLDEYSDNLLVYLNLEKINEIIKNNLNLPNLELSKYYYYIYIGKKNDNKYFCKCNFSPRIYEISKSKIVITKENISINDVNDWNILNKNELTRLQ